MFNTGKGMGNGFLKSAGYFRGNMAMHGFAKFKMCVTVRSIACARINVSAPIAAKWM